MFFVGMCMVAAFKAPSISIRSKRHCSCQSFKQFGAGRSSTTNNHHVDHSGSPRHHTRLLHLVWRLRRVH